MTKITIKAIFFLILLCSLSVISQTKLNANLVVNGDVSINDFLISPDGNTVVYHADQDTDNVFELYSVPITGGAPTKLNAALPINGDIDDLFLISPNSSTVVYAGDQDTDGIIELYSVPITGGTPTKLNGTLVFSQNVSVSDFLISPDGNTVVYQADQDTDGVFELYSVPITGGTSTKLNGTLQANGDVFTNDFIISPDGNTVVYQADQETDGVNEIFSVPITGGIATKLNTTLPANGDTDDFFLISPDSSTLVYIADQEINNVLELYSVPITGGTPTKLNATLPTNGDVSTNDFLISPNGTSVIYVAEQDADNVFEIYSVPITGGTPTKLNGTLPVGGDVDDFILISPNSSLVVYIADQATNDVFELYSVSSNALSTPNIEEETPVNVFVNDNTLYINTSNTYAKAYIYNVLGQAVMNDILINNNNTIDVSLLEKGVYILNLYDTNAIRHSIKFIKP